MADEFVLNANLTYEDSEMDDPISLAVVDLVASISTKKYTRAKQNVGTSEEAINLGEVTSPGWFMAINRDETNFVMIQVGTSGAAFAKLRPGEFCLLRLGTGATAPYAIADTAACQIEYMVFAT